MLGQAITPEGGTGSVTLSFVPGVTGYELFGGVQETSNPSVIIKPDEGKDNTYSIEETNLAYEPTQNMTEPEGEAPTQEDISAAEELGAAEPDTTTEAATSAAQGLATIDVLVGFANNFESVGAVESYIASQIAFMNQALLNSGVTLRVRVMKIIYVNYTQSWSNIVTDIDNLRSGAGDLWRLKAERDAIGADLVTMIVPNATNACGVAGRPTSVYGAREGGAYSVTATAPYCYRKFTLAHELGHSLGLSHNPEVPAAAPPIFPYSHGSSTPGVARDIMGYECWSGGVDTCPVRLQYSNPWINYLGTGVASGEPVYRHGARALNEMAATIANYRQRVRAWDVPTSHKFFKEINWMIGKRYSNGFSDGTYRPNDSVSREAMAAFLYRYAGSPSYRPPARSPFTDVPRGHKFYKQITWLSSTGITTGYKDGTFKPGYSISRQAMAAFFYRFAGSPKYTAPTKARFKDVRRSAQFYKEVSWLASTGITTGYGGGIFRPNEPVTRGAMAAFIYRYDRKF
ncbi:hypothetical protein G7066_07175 [Leucobacter coleopterorum]|uniref:SLH domain-containing protein n=1 Tax=Leucobacter coleopterorum TaxID=2714933 RepID=A0ABX6JVY9_9MICO|nr:S-layer homology domain-containing protein [Leucobacter coleopterorum]QIM18463.1 hypothetical protein G7066_07175 [Leucobacter coleopterorum]